MDASYQLDYDVYSTAREQTVYVLARIRSGISGEGLRRRPPLNLSLVLDRSGSMAGDKIEYVRQAAAFLVQHLSGQDRLSLVTYDHLVDVAVQPGPVTYKDGLIHALKQIKPGGSTNLSGGWLKGCQLVDSSRLEGGVNRVLLLTDGLANQGVTDAVRLAQMAAQQRSAGITTTTMGVGMGFNEDLLVRMAAQGGGAFYFIDNPDQAPVIFQEELSDLLNVVGQNLSILLIPALPGVKVSRQLTNYTAKASGPNTEFYLGDLFSEEEKLFLIALELPAHDHAGPLEIARLRFDYDELIGDGVEHRSLELPIVINLAAEQALPERTLNPEVEKSLLVLQAARAREEAIAHADSGDFAAAKQTLSGAADAIEHSQVRDPELQREHDMLREEAVDMELGASRYDEYARKTSVTKTFYTDKIQATSELGFEVHQRMRASRDAVERGGPSPDLLKWQQEWLDLREKQQIVIGRSEQCDIQLTEAVISSVHCQITRQGEALFLEDLGSRNGTYLNGGMLSGRKRLSVGDVFTVGGTLFMLRSAEEQQAPGGS